MPSFDDYHNLIPSQHYARPRYTEMLRAIIQPAVEVIRAQQQLRIDFDLDTAVGVQLDQVGMWVGRSRRLSAPLDDVYFSFDIEGLGFDEGAWQGKYDPTGELIDLDDESYRALIRIKIAANSWDGSLEQMIALFQEFVSFYTGAAAVVQDNQDMSMLMGIADSVPNAVLRALLFGGHFALKPAGVRVNYIVGSAPLLPLFGFDLDTPAVAGFDASSWGLVTAP